jgi:hypothetical protein
MVVKVVNDTAGLNRLVSTLLVFRVYLCITWLSASLALIIKRAEAVQTAIAKLRHLNAKH